MGEAEFNGKGLKQVFEPVKDQLSEWGMYAAGRRGKEIRKRGIEIDFTDAELDAMVKLGDQFPVFRKVFDEYESLNRRVLDFAEQSGVLDKATKQRYLNAGMDYLPYYRVALEHQRTATGTKASHTSLFSRLKGGPGNINEPIDNIYRNISMWIDASIKNRAKLRVYDDIIDEFGMDHIAAKLPRKPEFMHAVVLDKEAREVLKGMGALDRHGLLDVLAYDRPVQRTRKGNYVDVVYRKGKEEYWEIKDEPFRKAMATVAPEAFGLTVRILGGFANTLRRTVTMMPDFQLTNPFRDTQAAFLNTKNRSFIPFLGSLRGLKSRMVKDDNYWDSLINGAGFATLVKGETLGGGQLPAFWQRRGLTTQKVAEFYESKGIPYSDVLDTPAKIGLFGKRLINSVEEWTSGLEQATRLEEFRLSVKRGVGKREAALASREVSTDFALRGSSRFLQGFTTSVPFLNARAQGINKLVREARGNPINLAMRGITSMTIPSVALYLYNKDNPDYQSRPDWEKDTNYHIYVPFRKEPFLLPRGFEYGTLFGVLPERLLEAIGNRHGQSFLNAFGRAFQSSFGISGPQITQPILELMRNKKFSGAPIIPSDLERVESWVQYRPWTSDTFRTLAGTVQKETGVSLSPMKLEHLFRGYLGTLGVYLLQISDSLVREFSGKKVPTKRLTDYPVFKRFLRENPSKYTQHQADFYDLLNEAETAVKTQSLLLNMKEFKEVDRHRGGTEWIRGMKDEFRRVSEEASRINLLITNVYMDQTLSPKRMREHLDALWERRNALFRGAMKTYPRKQLLKRGIIPIPKPKPETGQDRINQLLRMRQ